MRLYIMLLSPSLSLQLTRRVNAFSTAASRMRRWRKSEANRAHGMKYPPLDYPPLVWKSYQDLLLL